MTEVKTVKAGRPKSAEKRNQIMIAASELFLEHGFTNASMDQVAKRSGVSKQTVYSHFSNKDALFTAVIEWKCNQYRLAPDALQSAELDLQEKLTQVGQQFLQLMQDPQVNAMYTVVIGEGRHNPSVASLFYEAGPKRAISVATQLLKHAPGLELTDHQAVEYSVDFFNLLKGEFHMKNMLGLEEKLKPGRADALVEHAVKKIMTLIKVLHNS